MSIFSTELSVNIFKIMHLCFVFLKPIIYVLLFSHIYFNSALHTWQLHFQSVSHSSVRLMVIANLMISPPEAYVLKYATVRYKVEQIRQNAVTGKILKWSHCFPNHMTVVPLSLQKVQNFLLVLKIIILENIHIPSSCCNLGGWKVEKTLC